ncbi:hypothetical protein ACFWNK_21790 [Streptomyces sp. NPDC058417]|uniref:hypothetical protein n=1 Tax=unclassified Streptomyces TaxID=2593676 RepID=UPI00366264D3
MQNRVKLPCGLHTGSGPRFNSRRTLVTCSAAFCDNEATNVLEFVPREGSPERWGAYCENCPERRIAPAAEVDAAREQGIRTQGEHFDTTRLPLSDENWRYREFTDDERVEIDLIKNGELVETCVRPGVFEWHKPRNENEGNIRW